MLDWKTLPSLFLLTYEKDGEWVAMGSRKWIDISFESKMDEYEYTMSWESLRRIEPAPRHIDIYGKLVGVTAVTAHTQLAAIGALIDALRKEEEEEQEQARRSADIRRFGGEVNEELIRKVVRWRKKQAKKASKERNERQLDYDDWDF